VLVEESFHPCFPVHRQRGDDQSSYFQGCHPELLRHGLAHFCSVIAQFVYESPAEPKMTKVNIDTFTITLSETLPSAECL